MAEIRRRRGCQRLVLLACVAAAVGVACSGDEAPATQSIDSLSPGATSSIGQSADAPTAGEPIRDGLYDWTRQPLGGGGFVTGIVSAIDGTETVLYARTDVGGAYRWVAASGAWEQMLRSSSLDGDELLPGDYSVASVAVAPTDPSIVYLAVGNDYNPSGTDELSRTGRVLRSSDGGVTWSASSNEWFVAGNQRFRTGTERLAIDPVDPDHLYFGTQREGLWESSDAGRSWEPVPLTVVPDGVAGDITAEQAGVSFVAASLDAQGSPVFTVGVANTGIFVNPGGTDWRMVEAIPSGSIPAGPSVIGDDLFVTVNTVDGSPGRLLRISSDQTVSSIDPPRDGATWHLAIDPTDPTRMALADEAVRSEHLWTSDDGGSSWRVHDIAISSPEIPWLEQTNLASYMSVGRLMFDPAVSGRLWFAEGMGVWMTDDLSSDTIVWESRSRGIEETVVAAILTRPVGDPLVAVADRQGFDLGQDGTYPDAPLIDDRFASGTGLDYSGGAPQQLAWVGAESNIGLSPDRVPRGAVSDDDDDPWREMDGLDQEMFGGEVAISASDPETIVWLPTYYADPSAFLSDPVGLWVTHDGGRTWDRTIVDEGVDSFHRLFWWFTRRALAADRMNGDFYLMSDEERFYVSSDGARSWQQAAYSPPCTVASDCHVFGQVQAHPSIAGELWASAGTAGLFRSTDAGATPWEAIPGIVEAQAFAIGAPMDGSAHHTIFVVGRQTADDALAIHRSTSGGETWVEISRHPYDLAMGINALAADQNVPGRIFVGFAGAGVVIGDDPAP